MKREDQVDEKDVARLDLHKRLPKTDVARLELHEGHPKTDVVRFELHECPNVTPPD